MAAMTTSANEKSRRVLAATTKGLVDEELPPRGVSEQPFEPPPDDKLVVIATAGHQGKAHCETLGAAIVGGRGLATVKRYGVAYAGRDGCAGGGPEVTAIVSEYGKAQVTADGGIAVARHWGEAVAGGQGIAIAFLDGVASAGEGSVIIIGYREVPEGPVRFRVGLIGQQGLLPGVRYMLNANHDFVVVPSPTDTMGCVGEKTCPEMFSPPPSAARTSA